MKSTASNPNATTQPQTRDSRLNTGPAGAKSNQEPTNAASASQRATDRAKRGNPGTVQGKGDRSPKQENL